MKPELVPTAPHIEAAAPGPSSLHDAVRDDARALNRALGVQLIGYALKAGLPFLLALATQAYGAAQWGVFVALQALVMLAVRVALFGLDKATLWWVGAHEPREMPRALIPAAALATLSSLIICGALALGGAFVLERWNGTSVEQLPALLVMLIGLPLMATTDVLLHASMGQRKMGAQVAIRDTLVPVLWLVSALGFHAFGFETTGLSWAFVFSQGVGLVAALVSVVARGQRSPASLSLRPPPGLLHYALPVWLNEMANTTLLRVDTLMLVALTDPLTVGIWGVIAQFGNAMRTIRRAFDPILVAVTARISKAHDSHRLAQALSYATQLVSLSQLPVFVFLLLFAGLLLPMYGKGFEQGSSALVVLCAFWLVSGSLSLPGVVLAGYGHARLGLIVTLIGIALQVPLLFLFVPSYGLVGAALAVGIANLAQQFIQLWQMKRLTGGFHYTERARRTFGPTLIAGAATALAWLSATRLGASHWYASSAAFAAFVCGYGISVGRQWRAGLLRAPGHDKASEA
jgi:O-antigen/teichoic acid export membrane protein